MKRLVFLVPLAALIGACSVMLPQAHTNAGAFSSFDAARGAIEALVPMRSTRQTLEKNGLSPSTHPNTKLLTHSDVVRLLVPAALIRRDDLDPGILACLEARDACTGLEIIDARLTRNRTGNFFADFINFRRKTETTGWRFNALVLFVNDLVVYRSWGGQPAVHEIEVTSNPLGPFQDIGPAAVSGR